MLDTNSLIYSIRNKVDLRNMILNVSAIGAIQVPMCVIDELTGLSESIPDARGALALARRFDVVPSEGKGDECIIRKAKDTGSFVLTNDRELIRRLKSSGIGVLSIRARRTVDFV